MSLATILTAEDLRIWMRLGHAALVYREADNRDAELMWSMASISESWATVHRHDILAFHFGDGRPW